MLKTVLNRAYKILEEQNYERICLLAGLCPKCGREVEYTCRNTKESPVIENKYICLACGYTVEEHKLTNKISEKVAMLSFKPPIGL